MKYKTLNITWRKIYVNDKMPSNGGIATASVLYPVTVTAHGVRSLNSSQDCKCNAHCNASGRI